MCLVGMLRHTTTQLRPGGNPFLLLFERILRVSNHTSLLDISKKHLIIELNIFYIYSHSLALVSVSAGLIFDHGIICESDVSAQLTACSQSSPKVLNIMCHFIHPVNMIFI